jgi:hypothetical protein
VTADPDDESLISEISIAPNGRIYVFGASDGVLQLLAGLAPTGSDLRARVAHIQSLGKQSPNQEYQPVRGDCTAAATIQHAPNQETT